MDLSGKTGRQIVDLCNKGDSVGLENTARSENILEIITLSDDFNLPIDNINSDTAILDLCLGIDSPNTSDKKGPNEDSKIVDLCQSNDSTPSNVSGETQSYLNIPNTPQNVDLKSNINIYMPNLSEEIIAVDEINKQSTVSLSHAVITENNVVAEVDPASFQRINVEPITQTSGAAIILDETLQKSDLFNKDSTFKNPESLCPNQVPQNNNLEKLPLDSESIANQVVEFSENFDSPTQLTVNDNPDISLKRRLDDSHQYDEYKSMSQYPDDSNIDRAKKSKFMTEMEDPDDYETGGQTDSRTSKYLNCHSSFMKHIKLYWYYPTKTRKPIFPTKIKHLEDGSVRRFLGHELKYHIKTLIATQGRRARPDTKDVSTNTSFDAPSDKEQPNKSNMQYVNQNAVSQKAELQKIPKKTPPEPVPGTSRMSNMSDLSKTILPMDSVPFGIPIAFQKLYAKIIMQDGQLAIAPKLESQRNPDGTYHFWWSFPAVPVPIASPCAGIPLSNVTNTQKVTSELPASSMAFEYQNDCGNIPPFLHDHKFNQPFIGQRIPTPNDSSDSESLDSDSNRRDSGKIVVSALVHRSEEQTPRAQTQPQQQQFITGPEELRLLNQQQVNINELSVDEQEYLDSIYLQTVRDFINEKRRMERQPINIISQYVLPGQNPRVEQRQQNISNRPPVNDDRNMIIEGRRPNIVQHPVNVNQQDSNRPHINMPIINERDQVIIQHQPQPINIAPQQMVEKRQFYVEQNPENIVPLHLLERQQPNIEQQRQNAARPRMFIRQHLNIEQLRQNIAPPRMLERPQLNIEQLRQNIAPPRMLERPQLNIEQLRHNIAAPRVLDRQQLNIEQLRQNIAPPHVLERQQLNIEHLQQNIAPPFLNVRQQPNIEQQHNVALPHNNERQQPNIEQLRLNIAPPRMLDRQQLNIEQLRQNIAPPHVLERQQPNIEQQHHNVALPHNNERQQPYIEQQRRNIAPPHLNVRQQPNIVQQRYNIAPPHNNGRQQPNIEQPRQNIAPPLMIGRQQPNVEQEPQNIAPHINERRQPNPVEQPANIRLPHMIERRQPNEAQQPVNVLPRLPRIPEQPVDEQRRIERVVDRVPLDVDFQMLPIDPRPMLIERRQANNELNPINNQRPLLIERRPVNIGFRLINVAHRPMEIEQVVNFEERVINIDPEEPMDEEDQDPQENSPEREIDFHPNSPQNRENEQRRQLESPPLQNVANDRPRPAVSPPAGAPGPAPVVAHIRLQPLGSPPRRAYGNNQNVNVRDGLPVRGSPDWVAINREWPLPSPDSTV